MASPLITINQTGLPAGVGGESRRDLVTGVEVTLSDSANPSATLFEWSLVPPYGSSATLSSATDAEPTFTPDVSGAYLIFLQVNGFELSYTLEANGNRVSSQGGAGIELENGTLANGVGETRQFSTLGWGDRFNSLFPLIDSINGPSAPTESIVVRTGTDDGTVDLSDRACVVVTQAEGAGSTVGFDAGTSGIVIADVESTAGQTNQIKALAGEASLIVGAIRGTGTSGDSYILANINAEGVVVHGSIECDSDSGAFSFLDAIDIGALSGGSLQIESGASGLKAIRAGGEGSIAHGFLRAAGSGVCQLATDGDGAIALGAVRQTGGSIASQLRARTFGSFAFGYAQDGDIESSGRGSFAGGYAIGSAVTVANISADGDGSFAFGVAENGAMLRSDGDGGVCFGYASAGSTVVAGGGCITAGGTFNVGGLSAVGAGAVCLGWASNGGSLAANGSGAVVMGLADGVSIEATGNNCMQFGPGSNDVNDTFSIGNGMRFKMTAGAPALPRAGDMWVDGGIVYVYSNGVAVAL